jgi:hypothetical protein
MIGEGDAPAALEARIENNHRGRLERILAFSKTAIQKPKLFIPGS